MNWQAEHERLMAEMCKLLGLPPNSNNQAINAAAAKADDTIRAEYERLNSLDNIAVKNAEKQA